MANGFYFHGTVSDLCPGENLEPGNFTGITVHGRSEHVYMTHTADETGREHAIKEAIMWAAFAADELGCIQGENCPSIEDGSLSWHSDGDSCGWLTPDCFNVLEVEPVGEVEEDNSEAERGEVFFRAESALILKTVSREEVWDALMS